MFVGWQCFQLVCFIQIVVLVICCGVVYVEVLDNGFNGWEIVEFDCLVYEFYDDFGGVVVSKSVLWCVVSWFFFRYCGGYWSYGWFLFGWSGVECRVIVQIEGWIDVYFVVFV